jgi:hypothetical protein
MESLDAILKMNEKHPPGRRSASIADLCARVAELEKENKELREKCENTSQAPPAPISGTEAPAHDTRGCPPSDATLIGFLAAYPRRSLAQICKRFGVPYAQPPYPPGVKAIRDQLQRLRKANRIRSEGNRWTI